MPHSHHVKHRAVSEDSLNQSSVQNGGFVKNLNEISDHEAVGNFAAAKSIQMSFANITVTANGNAVQVDGKAFGGNGKTGSGTAKNTFGSKSTVFYGTSNYTGFYGKERGQNYSNLIAFSNAAVIVGRSGYSDTIVSGGVAIGGKDAAGNSVEASIDVINGATIHDGTAASGGVLLAGGFSNSNHGVTTGRSLLQDAHILSSGVAIAGGNKDLVLKKNGTSGIAIGTGVISDAVVDAGGVVDANGSGTVAGGTIAGYAIAESGGTISGALFQGAADGGVNGANGYIDANGLAVGNTIQGGAVLSVAGGVASENIVNNGGTVEVGANYANQVAQANAMGSNSNGTWTVLSGSSNFGSGTSIDGVVNNGGTQIVASGGVDSDTTVMAGGVVSVNESGVDYGATLSEGGTMVVSDGATASETNILQGATMLVQAGGSVDGAVVGAGMNDWAGGVTLTDASPNDGVIVSQGATFANGTLADGVGEGTSPTQMGGLLRVEKGATVTDLQMGNYGELEVMGVDYGAGESVTYHNNTVTLMSDGKSVWSATLAGSYNSGSFQIWDDNGTAVIVYDTCFLRGTRIATPQGEIEVQDLKAGDELWAFVDGKEVARKITFIQHKESNLRQNLPVDLAGWAVCVKAGAFGAHLPEQDLWVTAEHSFLFEGRFVPVRMLVNGRTIYYDTSLAAFDFFHVETEPHSIIKAEGVLTESWLNTEERREAVNLPNDVIRLERIPSHSWEKDAAAPLDVSLCFVRSLWNKFEAAALAQKVSLFEEQVQQFSKDPALRIRLGNGKLIKPANKRRNQYFFQIPAGQTAQSLVSKIFRPSESVGPWIDDRRQLGVLVGKVLVGINTEFHAIDAHHYHVANAPGWDVVENTPCRWTKGEATLPSFGKQEVLQFGYSLIIEILAGGPYPDQKLAEEIPEKLLKKEA
ncbi:hypothetical protein FAI40_06625 [Acetobacteraceae bacterium]|nr:hypothetical protein FAI40_06625 [Acetobacteraceae bacterium]